MYMHSNIYVYTQYTHTYVYMNVYEKNARDVDNRWACTDCKTIRHPFFFFFPSTIYRI